MRTYVVSYDLHSPGQNYEELRTKLANYPEHARIQQSVWVILTLETAEQIKNKLSRSLDANDGLFISALSDDMAIIEPKRSLGMTLLQGW